MTGLFDTLANSGPLLRDAVQSRNLKVLASMLGPAFRGFLQQRGKNEPLTPVRLKKVIVERVGPVPPKPPEAGPPRRSSPKPSAAAPPKS